MAGFNGAVFVNVLFILSLRLDLYWSQFADSFPVRLCVIGEGSGFTCSDATDDIQCQSNYCVWKHSSGKVIGSSLNLNETSEYGEYYLVDTRDVTRGLVFVMPKGKACL